MARLKTVDALVGRRIRLRRIQLKIDARSLAADVRIKEARLHAYEAGQESVGAALLAEIAGVLDVSSAYFYSAPPSGGATKKQTQVMRAS